jgi:hypothetical protein
VVVGGRLPGVVGDFDGAYGPGERAGGAGFLDQPEAAGAVQFGETALITLTHAGSVTMLRARRSGMAV